LEKKKKLTIIYDVFLNLPSPLLPPTALDVPMVEKGKKR
jgi:hypothetical protein